MVTIAELKKIREHEGKLLKIESKKLLEARKLDSEKQELIKDIKKIRVALSRDKNERRAKSNAEIQKIKSGAKKAGKKVLDYLYALRGY